MKLNFIIILSIILSALSFNENKPNFCSKCKFFIDSNKCSLFPIIKYSDGILNDFFINNFKKKKVIIKDFRYCIIARKYDTMCGESGKMYEENEDT